MDSPLLKTVEQLANLGIWEWHPGSDEYVWSDNLYRIFGLAPGGTAPGPELLLELIHPDDRDRVAGHHAMARLIGDPPSIEFRVSKPGLGVIFLRSTVTTVECGALGSKRIVATVQDVTEHRLANREIRAHVAVSAVLAEWEGFEPSGQRLLRGVAEAMEFVFAALWLPENDVMSARLLWSDSPAVETAEFEAVTMRLRLPRGVGLVGRVWERQTTIDVPDVVSDASYCRREPAARAELKGAVAVPAAHAGEVLAVLEFYYHEESRPTARSTQAMSAIGHEFGEFLSRRWVELHDQPLTPRELQVLQLAANGYSGPEIAERLAIRPTTIATHMKSIFQRLGVSDRAAAVAAGIRLGLIE